MMQRIDIVNELSALIKDADPAVKSILSITIKKIEATPKEYDKCLRCGKKLKTPISRKRGYGEECYNKMIESRFHANKLIRATEVKDANIRTETDS